VVGFVDAGTLTVKLHNAWLLNPGDIDYGRGQAGRQHWMDAIETELAIPNKLGTGNLDDTPGETDHRGADLALHTKDNTGQH
jgi:hypothetical protein